MSETGNRFEGFEQRQSGADYMGLCTFTGAQVLSTDKYDLGSPRS